MSLSKSALKKMSKDEVFALALEHQNKFDSTLTDINNETSGKMMRKYSKNFAFPDKSD